MTTKIAFNQIDGMAVSVKDFGAVGDGVTDDTVAIQAAFDAGDHVHLPNVDGEKYLVSASLGINAEVTGGRIRESFRLTADVSTRDGSHVLQVAAGAGIEAAIQVLDGVSVNNILTNCSFENISIDGNGESVFGLACGKWGSTINQLVKFFHTENLSVKGCRFGYLIGGAGVGIETDSASYTNSNALIEQNTDGGVLVDTGNGAGITFTGASLLENGYSPTTDSYNSAGEGFNVKVFGGEVNFYGGHSAGLGANKPATADVIASSADVRINGWWSDTHGTFLKESGGTSGSLYIAGLRHNEGNMTGGNTPVSIQHVCKMTITGSLLYGVIESNEGSSGSLTTIGVNFVSGGAAAGNSTAYTGTLKTNQKGVVSINNFGNRAQIVRGGGARDMAHLGAFTPLDLMIGAGSSATGPTCLTQSLGPASTDSGFTEYLDKDTGTKTLYVNCYKSDTSGNIAPMVVGKDCHIFDFGGGSYDTFTIRRYKFSSSTPVAQSNFTQIFSILQGTGDAYLGEVVVVPPKLTADPVYSSGDYWEGGLYYNTTTNKHRANTGGTTWVDLY